MCKPVSHGCESCFKIGLRLWVLGVFVFVLSVSALGLLQFDYCLFCFYVVLSVSSPFRILRQADHIAEGKARPRHRELHAKLFSTSVWDL